METCQFETGPPVDRGGAAGHHEGRGAVDYPQGAPSEGGFRQTWIHRYALRVFGDLERTTCATPYCRVSKQDGDGFIIRHSVEEREGQDEGKVSEDENSPNEVPDTAKRRKLEDIEDQVMKEEEDPTKTAELFRSVLAEYLNDREDIGGNERSQCCSGNKRRDRISQRRVLRWEWKRSPKATVIRGSS